MRRVLRRGWPALVVLAVALGLSVAIARQGALVTGWQERVFDGLMRLRPVSGDQPVVVDISAEDDTGAPWSRATTARLMEALLQAKPAVVGFDIIFSGDCGPGPVNDRFARAIARVPVVLGFLLADRPSDAPTPRPVIAVAEGAGASLWSAPGAEGPCPDLARAARSVAPVSLFGDSDARVRRVPAVIAVAGAAYPALAVELAHIARADPAPVLGVGPWLRSGDRIFPLELSAQLRLHATGPQVWAARTVTAADVLAGRVSADRFAGAIVLVGSSLPQRGGLRPTAASPLHPSVQIHADLVADLMAGPPPYRPTWAAPAEAGFVVVAGVAALVLLVWLPPLSALAGLLGLVTLWAGGTVGVHLWRGWLVDPALPSVAAVLPVLLALLARAATSARAERRLRARMGQLLPPAIVTRIADNPDLLRLGGEARVVTALFTDLEGFSATTRQIGPQDLVRLLDAYFTLTCRIVLDHGGMIDKLVGDSVHALFNAPLDQPDHVDRALACAAALVAATEAFRSRPDIAATGLGRTRIGLESGMAVLGDVGAGGKIDYTAHGDAVNLAARLQEINKTLGTAVCIGPGAAALVQTPLRPLGQVEIRSFGTLDLFTLTDGPPRQGQPDRG